MTYIPFALLLTAYVILVASDYIAGALPIHPDRVRIDAVKEHLTNRPKLFVAIYGIASSIFIILFISGLIGLYFLWAFAPYLFLAGLIGKFADSIVIPVKNERNQLERILEEIQFLLEGFLLAILFFGPAKHLFSELA